jgi:hypothetical protein
MPFYFVQTSLYSFQTRKEYVLAHLTRCCLFEQIQFMISPARSRWLSNGQTCVIFHGPFDHSQKRSKGRMCSDYNRRWIMVVFRLSSSRRSSPVERWDSRKNYIKMYTGKCLIPFIWQVNWTHSLLHVPKWTICNSIFFRYVIVPDLLENVRAYSWRRALKRVCVHANNGCPHNSKKYNEHLTEFRTSRVPHPADSPDHAPSDFFLFGTVKTELSNYEIHSRQDPNSAIRAIFDEVPKDALNVSTFHG